MKKEPSQPTICEVSELTRLLIHLQHCAIDSEGTSIRPDEVPVIADVLIRRLVWQHPNFEEVMQEALDDLRFGHRA